MKVRLFTFGCVALISCTQQAEPVPDSEKPQVSPAESEADALIQKPEPEAAPPETKAADPVETCEALVKAASEGDSDSFGANATDAALEAMAKSQAMSAAVIESIAEATCGEATVQADAASVSVAVGDTTRQIPFVLVGDDWKFDGAAYLAKYPMPEEPKAVAKKGKKKKRRKNRRKE